MYKILKIINKWIVRRKYQKLQNAVTQGGLKIVDKDDYELAILAELQETSILITLSPDGKKIELESTIIYDGELNNLKTFSSIAHTAYFYKFHISGISSKSDYQSRFYVGKEIDFIRGKALIDILHDVNECLQTIVGYLYYRNIQMQTRTLDLSMFENVDLCFFDPQLIGEKKDFIYGSWNTYVESIVNEDSDKYYDHAGTVEIIKACALFEEENNLLLSEVGKSILDEIAWNREFRESSENDEYSIN